jgi:hypothetical protein
VRFLIVLFVLTSIGWTVDFRVTTQFVISSMTLGLGLTVHFRLTCFRDEVRGSLLKV